MNFFSRFFGRGAEDEPAEEGGGALLANPAIENPLSLQLLLGQAFRPSSDDIRQALRQYHPSMAKARCEVDPELLEKEQVFGLVGWGKHVVQLVGFFNTPMPEEAVEACVGPSHYPEDLKLRARQHSSHMLLYYAGHEDSAMEQYVALAAVAGAMDRLDAIVVLNEPARTSFPTAALSGQDSEGDILELVRSLPLLILFCGFVKYSVEAVEGIWMRTHGAHLLQLPDFAVLAQGHHEGETYFELFNSIMGYLQESGAHMDDGHTMQFGENTYYRFRAPQKGEYFLESEGEMLVVETVASG